MAVRTAPKGGGEPGCVSSTRAAPARASNHSVRSSATAAFRELGVIALAALIYVAVRATTEGRADRAVANGRSLLRLEQTLHLDWEQALQGLVLGQPTLLKLANAVYIWGFWPVLAGAAVYLYVAHHEHYVQLRNAVFISSLIGFAFFALLPVAPPRLVDPHLLDTIHAYSPHYRPVALSDVTNEYAALPSLHFGWTLLVGVTVAGATRRWIAYAFAVFMPTAMALAVIVTANHYVIDVIVGGAVALTALAIARVVAARPAPGSRRSDRSRGKRLTPGAPPGDH
jgi:membrane-associated phospholipid phosphatase